MTLMDESGEIKGTAWNAVVDELFEKLQENRVYFVSKARVNLAKKKFSTVTNDYELSLDRGTEIEEVKYSLHSHRSRAQEDCSVTMSMFRSSGTIS